MKRASKVLAVICMIETVALMCAAWIVFVLVTDSRDSDCYARSRVDRTVDCGARERACMALAQASKQDPSIITEMGCEQTVGG